MSYEGLVDEMREETTEMYKEMGLGEAPNPVIKEIVKRLDLWSVHNMMIASRKFRGLIHMFDYQPTARIEFENVTKETSAQAILEQQRRMIILKNQFGCYTKIKLKNFAMVPQSESMNEYWAHVSEITLDADKVMFVKATRNYFSGN